jgi:hypothetical protein
MIFDSFTLSARAGGGLATHRSETLRDTAEAVTLHGPLWTSAAHRSGRSGWLARRSRVTW